MKSLEEDLARYAAHHRDRRNIATHFFGIPLIVFAIVLTLAIVSIPAGGVTITMAALASIGTCAFYFRLDPAFGTAMATTLFLMCALASEITARLADGGVLALAAALFAAGWALQFWGHRFEGVKTAFPDDAKQLFIAPLFVCAEVFFFFGAKTALRRFIEERAGPTVARRGHSPGTGTGTR